MTNKKRPPCAQGSIAIIRTLYPRIRFRVAVLFSAFLLALPVLASAQETGRPQLSPSPLQMASPAAVESPLGPQLPCGTESAPLYPLLDDSAIVRSWHESELGRDWRPPACTGWSAMGFSTLVTTSARFHHPSEAAGLLRSFGAFSEFAGMRYWSTTHKQWQTLIVEAHALTDAQPGQRRADFSPEELSEGKVLFFEQVDNLSGKAVYRMHIVEASPVRIVIAVENVTTMRYLLIPIFHPGEMQTIYFLDRESENVWRFYSILRTGKNANRLIAGNESSSINRAVAFYRHFVGIPTNQEPPAAR
jgi:uncharacterized protein DUF6675